MDSPRVLLADDHPRFADAVGRYVAETFRLVGTVRDGGALLEAAKTLTPDVIVADISMPGTDGLTALKQIQKDVPHMRVIVLTNHGDPWLARHALDAGAHGFVLKAYAATELVDAIRTVVDGRVYVSRVLEM